MAVAFIFPPTASFPIKGSAPNLIQYDSASNNNKYGREGNDPECSWRNQRPRLYIDVEGPRPGWV